MYKTFACFVLFLVHILSLGSCSDEFCNTTDPPQVLLSTGCVEGILLTTVLGRSFFSFRGIPYAAPPVGQLRFREPKPVANWTGVFHAVKDSAACIQPWRDPGFPITYSEDCLYLNVNTPYLKPPNNTLMPVILWIHGGQFYKGSGASYKYGADFLLMKDVVVVTINYRLGVFGYLNMNVSEAQGNAALKDKVAALRWVKKEISKFGGDPNLVTVVGGSSGGGSVGLLRLSPMSKGLFHRAISHSAGALCACCLVSCTVSLGLSLAQSLGCPTHSPQAAVTCLLAANGTVLAEKQVQLKGLRELEIGLRNPFMPSVEFSLGEEVFLSDTPKRMIASGKTSDVPYIVGFNDAEGHLFLEDPRRNPDQLKNFERDIISYLPRKIVENKNQQVLLNISLSVHKFYFKNSGSVGEKLQGFTKYMSDMILFRCTMKSIDKINDRSPVFLYYFTFDGNFKRPNWTYKKLNVSGVSHGEELGYLFYFNYSIPTHNNLSAYPKEMAVVQKMVNLWTNFASNGNPTPEGNEMNITWEPIEKNVSKHLIINDSLQMSTNSLMSDHVSFWDDLYGSDQSVFKSSECPT